MKDISYVCMPSHQILSSGPLIQPPLTQLVRLQLLVSPIKLLYEQISADSKSSQCGFLYLEDCFLDSGHTHY